MTRSIAKRLDRQPYNEPPIVLLAVDRFAVAAIVVQLVCMITLSYFLCERYALTGDFGGFYHAWYAIAHGNLNPVHQDSKPPFPFLANHGEVMMYLFAPFYYLVPGPFGLRLLQDLSAAGASVVAYVWIRALVLERARELLVSPTFICAVGVCLIAFNPWPIWSNAFDFHFQATAACFVLLAGYWFWKRHVMAGLAACVLVAFCGDVTSTFLVGLGTSMLFMRDLRATGAVVAGLGLGAFLVIHAFGGGQGYGGLETIYGDIFLPDHPTHVGSAFFLKFLLTHPGAVAATLAQHAREIFANIAPSGAIGVLHPFVWGIVGITLVENDLTSGFMFAQPSFQSFPVYGLVAVGTVWFVLILARRARVATLVIGWVLALNAAIWAASFLPFVPGRFVVVTPAAASELARINRMIPRDEEVIAGEAFVGGFADRPVYANGLLDTFALRTWPAHFVFAPYEGVNIHSVNADLARLALLVEDPHASIEEHGAGVWSIAYTQNLRAKTPVRLDDGAATIPAWTMDGAASAASFEGPRDSWHLESAHTRGTIMKGAYWRLAAGHYRATIDCSSTEPILFEIRNASAEIVLARLALPASTRRRTYATDFMHSIDFHDLPYHGWGPFAFDPIPFPSNSIELRAYVGGTGLTKIYRVGIIPIGHDGKPLAQ